jgi:hypothetical protein
MARRERLADSVQWEGLRAWCADGRCCGGGPGRASLLLWLVPSRWSLSSSRAWLIAHGSGACTAATAQPAQGKKTAKKTARCAMRLVLFHPAPQRTQMRIMPSVARTLHSTTHHP